LIGSPVLANGSTSLRSSRLFPGQIDPAPQLVLDGLFFHEHSFFFQSPPNLFFEIGMPLNFAFLFVPSRSPFTRLCLLRAFPISGALSLRGVPSLSTLNYLLLRSNLLSPPFLFLFFREGCFSIPPQLHFSCHVLVGPFYIFSSPCGLFVPATARLLFLMQARPGPSLPLKVDRFCTHFANDGSLIFFQKMLNQVIKLLLPACVARKWVRFLRPHPRTQLCEMDLEASTRLRLRSFQWFCLLSFFAIRQGASPLGRPFTIPIQCRCTLKPVSAVLGLPPPGRTFY